MGEGCKGWFAQRSHRDLFSSKGRKKRGPERLSRNTPKSQGHSGRADRYFPPLSLSSQRSFKTTERRMSPPRVLCGMASMWRSCCRFRPQTENVNPRIGSHPGAGQMIEAEAISRRGRRRNLRICPGPWRLRGRCRVRKSTRRICRRLPSCRVRTRGVHRDPSGACP